MASLVRSNLLLLQSLHGLELLLELAQRLLDRVIGFDVSHLIHLVNRAFTSGHHRNLLVSDRGVLLVVWWGVTLAALLYE